ncbi:hypothetical protein HIM_00982 [Hirsutella minnesotensis 3608]|nr:hypothetical protein HIM_00982 [Hirsutella minnesotensis 3608]
MPDRLLDHQVLVFDCYGTIIDWETGVLTALEPLLRANNASFSRQHLLDVYHECEAAQQQKTPDLAYDKMLAAILPQIATNLGLANGPSAASSQAFGESIGTWPAFPDSVDALARLARHFKLVILSNVDGASFARTNAGPLRSFPFDLVLTAQEIGSYKPDARNFEYMLRAVEEELGLGRGAVIQTAQSQFHDHHPARRLGLKSSWITRPGSVMGNRDEVVYDWKFATLRDMADALEAEMQAR